MKGVKMRRIILVSCLMFIALVGVAFVSSAYEDGNMGQLNAFHHGGSTNHSDSDSSSDYDLPASAHPMKSPGHGLWSLVHHRGV